jgi:hypothetical protein
MEERKMIHWFIFNFMALAVSLSLILNIHNEITTLLGWALLIVVIVLMIKDFFALKG